MSTAGAGEMRLRPTFGSTLLVIAAVGAGALLASIFVAARQPLGWVFATAVVAWLLSAIIALLTRWMPRAIALLVTVLAVAGIGIGAWVGIGATIGTELDNVQKALPPAAEKLEQRSPTARDFRLAERVDTLVRELESRFGTRAACRRRPGPLPRTS